SSWITSGWVARAITLSRRSAMMCSAWTRLTRWNLMNRVYPLMSARTRTTGFSSMARGGGTAQGTASAPAAQWAGVCSRPGGSVGEVAELDADEGDLLLQEARRVGVRHVLHAPAVLGELGVRVGRVVGRPVPPRRAREEVLRRGPRPPRRPRDAVLDVVVEGGVVDGHVGVEVGDVEDAGAGRAAGEDDLRTVRVGAPPAPGVVPPRRLVEGLGQGDARHAAAVLQEVQRAPVGVERLAHDEGGVVVGDLAPAPHEPGRLAAGVLDGPRHAAPPVPPRDPGADGLPRGAGHAPELVVEDEGAAARGVRHDVAGPEGELGAAGLLLAVVVVVGLVVAALPSEVGDELGGGAGGVEVVAFERDPVGGVEVGRPRERVVHPVVAAGAGHVHRRVAERPHGAAVDDGADGAVAPPDGLVLGDDA